MGELEKEVDQTQKMMGQVEIGRATHFQQTIRMGNRKRAGNGPGETRTVRTLKDKL